MFEAIRNHSSVVFLGLLIHPRTVFGVMLRDDDRKIAGRKEKGLVTEQACNSGERHRATVPAKLRKSLSLCNAIGIP